MYLPYSTQTSASRSPPRNWPSATANCVRRIGSSLQAARWFSSSNCATSACQSVSSREGSGWRGSALIKASSDNATSTTPPRRAYAASLRFVTTCGYAATHRAEPARLLVSSTMSMNQICRNATNLRTFFAQLRTTRAAQATSDLTFAPGRLPNLTGLIKSQKRNHQPV